MQLKKIFLFLSMVLVLFAFTGCALLSSKVSANEKLSPDNVADEKMKVVVTLFPYYDFVKQIAKDRVQVEALLPPGVESHSFEPTPQQIISINSSELFIFTGAEMEPWAKKILDGASKDSLHILEAAKLVELEQHDEHSQEDEEHEEHSQYDPHIWTDPNNVIFIAEGIAQQLCNLDSINSDFYKSNFESFKNELIELDREYRSVINAAKRREVIFGGRNAFYYLLDRYGITADAIFDFCSTETVPSLKTVAAITEKVKRNQIPVIFYEEMKAPSIANSIAKETGAQALLLHSCHNVSKDELNSGVSYISLMKKNLENLKIALN